MIRPRDEEIEAIVERLEIGWLQARNHAIQRHALRERLAEDRRRTVRESIRNLAQQ